MLYSFKANVFATKLGPLFGKITYIVILADDEKQAFEEANKRYKLHCANLLKHNNNEFSFDRLEIDSLDVKSILQKL